MPSTAYSQSPRLGKDRSDVLADSDPPQVILQAVHLLNSICLQLRQDGINDSWNTFRARMSTHRRVSICDICNDIKYGNLALMAI